jgi:hydrophobe/amphiphile efflux-1 (HAE1) family protein
MKMTDVSIDRPVFATMMGMGALVLGGLALLRLGVDLFPDVSFPIVTVVTPYPGASPVQVETQVSRRIEEVVSSINGLDEVRSYSREGVSTVIATFKLDADIRQSASDVRDRVATIRGTLPRDVRDPIVSRVDPTAQAVVTYALRTNRGSLATRRFAEDVVQPALERVPGVGSIAVAGGEVREIRVEVDRAKLEGVSLSIAQVAQAIGGESFDVPGGRLTVGAREMSLQAEGRFHSPEEVGEVVLAAQPDGTQVRVRDVGRVVDGVSEARSLTRVDGVPSVTLEVQKQAGTNTVEVVDSVDAAVAKLGARLPPDVRIVKVIDAARFIRNNIVQLREALILGAVFAVAVIFLFMLDWRSTFISAIALPTSVVFTFFVMWQLGFTLNILSMLGLQLSVGLLIDDSVVVRENIFRHMERGEDPVTAARMGTREIALAVMATTFTVVAVFGPVAFTGGLVGRMFKQFGLTVAAAVLVSLVVSFTLDPMLSARIVQQIPHDYHERMRRHRFYGPIVRTYDALDAVYRRVLAWALGHGKTVFVGAVVLFVGSCSLTPLMGQEFFGRGDQGDFALNLEMGAGTSLAEMDRVTKEVESIVRRIPEVVTIATTVGPGEEVNKTSIRVKATPKAERERSLRDIMEELRPKLAAIPGLSFNMREAGLGGSAENAVAQAPIVLYVRGSDYGALGRLAQKAYDVVRSTHGVRDAAISHRPGLPERRLVLDRTRAGDLGVPFAAAAATLRTAFEGDPAAKFRDGEHDVDVRVRLRPEDRAGLEDVRALTVPSRSGSLVALREIVNEEAASTPATIERLDRERQITITANVVGRSLGEILEELGPKLDTMERPAGYTFRFSGEAERMQETFTNMGLALALAIVFIYLVLASQFESFLHPFTIMFSLPLAVVGALLSLFIFDFPIGMPAMIGIILLMGLVTKNAILLVDYANQLRARGKDIIEALLEAGPTRLRPILMTSAAMVLGMLPTAVGRGEGSEFRAPMSTAVIGGVITSTLLTLVVVPVVYVWVDRFTLRGRRARRAAREAAAQPAE